jgi:hypothetical protein
MDLTWLQVQMGWSGGHKQSLLSFLKIDFTIRSSNEWNEITANFPPGFKRLIA